MRHLMPTIYRYGLFSTTRPTSQEINAPSYYQGLNLLHRWLDFACRILGIVSTSSTSLTYQTPIRTRLWRRGGGW